MPENVSVPENEPELTETISAVLASVARRRWWIIFALFVATVVAIVVAFRLPDRYTSEATLVVVQQEVSQKYVSPDSNTSIVDIANALKREVLSGPRLSAIIEEVGLYPEESHLLAPGDIVERMRKDVEMEPLDFVPARGEFSTFKIAFSANNPRLAQQVTSRLAQLFIEENFKAQGNKAASTSSFLQEQLEAAKRQVADQEERLKNFKMRNSGELPEQQTATIGALTELRIQLQSITAGLAKAREQRESVEASMYDVLARLQAEKTALLVRLTPQHPDVIKKDREIASVQALIDNLKTGKLKSQDAQAQGPVDVSVAQLKRQVEASVLETQNLLEQQRQVNAEIAQYQARLNLAPVRDQELSALLRDYEVSKTQYTDLLKQKDQSQLTATMEERQEGQHFRMIEPPSLPSKPSAPNRVKISLGGAGAGILLGLVLAFFMEAKDRSFHTEKALSRAFPVPLVMGLPLLLTPAEKRARKWKSAFEWAAGSVAVVTVFAAEAYVFFHG